MSAYKATVRPLLFRIDPERVHNWTLQFLPLFPTRQKSHPQVLASKVAGLNFPSPIGLAAGFDKDARRFKKMYSFGFGSVEVGTLTPKGQLGNAHPRIERLQSDEAIINRMGFPNCGLHDALLRLKRFRARPGPLGINIGANADSSDKIGDYIAGYKTVAEIADYVTINVSSPNTPGLRTFESGKGLADLLTRLNSEVGRLETPLFLKVSPDLSAGQIEETCATLLESQVAAIIVGNTSIQRPPELKSTTAHSTGGLSGKPLSSISELALESFYSILGDKLPIVSVGGIASAEDAYRRICKGASLVQLYTAFIYEGPYLIKRMNAELKRLLLADGHSSISSAIGSSGSQSHSRTVRRAPSVRRQRTMRTEISQAVA